MSCTIQCVICTELMTEQCVVLFLECGHVYHQTCLNRWMRTSRTCPDCRVSVKITPHRLFLHFTEQTDSVDVNDEILQKNDLLEMTITKLEQQNEKKDRAIRFTLMQIDRLVNNNNRFKRVISTLENGAKLSTEKTAQLTRQLMDQMQQRQSLTAVVQTLREQEIKLHEKLKESKATIDVKTDEIRILDQAQADQIIENHQLELEKAELSTRLDEFRAEFVKINTELQMTKSENENLKNELLVRPPAKPKTIESNSNLKSHMAKTEETLLAIQSDNLNDASEAIKIIISNDGEYKVKMPKNLSTTEASPKRRSDDDVDYTYTKRTKVAEPSTADENIQKITIKKTPVGWSILP